MESTKKKIARRTLKCIEESLEAPKDGSDYHGRFICAHCDNEYIAVDMSDLELKYLKQILDHIWCPCNGPGGDGNSPNDPIDDGSRINDSTKHRLVYVLNMPPFHDVDQIFRDYSIGQIDEVPRIKSLSVNYGTSQINVEYNPALGVCGRF
ncbi:MAG: hypothetical protein WBF33_21790 [Candidatus Nitrosopolaris sp.]